ncbi:MAG: carbohydrate ABC transporter permease [Planctomycetota bacterium]|nr:carbohydrate ABC transporter permease [Planctomycetota bacterium]
MPIISRIGRHQSSQKAMYIGVYVLLTLGAVTIIYPLLIMLGQTTSDRFDLRDNAVVASYLSDKNELALKNIFAMTSKLDLLASRHNRNTWSSQTSMRDDGDFSKDCLRKMDELGLSIGAWKNIITDLNSYKATLDSDDLIAREFRLEDFYRPFLREKYGRKADEFRDGLEKTGRLPRWFQRANPESGRTDAILADRDLLGTAIMNHELRSDYLNYYGVELQSTANVVVPFWRPDSSAKSQMWSEFKASLPPEQKLVVPSDTYWHTYLRLKYHERIQDLNKAWGTAHQGFYELKFPHEPPADATVLDNWREFVVKRWPRRMLAVPKEFTPAWQDYVRKQLVSKAGGDEQTARAQASQLVGKTIYAWDSLELPRTRPDDATLSRYWCEFTASGIVPPEKLILGAPEPGFRQFLRVKYGKTESEALAALNAAWQGTFENFDQVPLPVALADFAPAHFEPGSVRLSFLTESFERVWEYMSGRGRAIQNTAVLVFFAILAALTINPIAAYSLSRFPMKHTQKVLIFFLATMAFPAEVAMIPNFLLLRDLGLLNTYAALILPGMANGYSIFLLKGFFDSLPRELFEAAEMDGASETQVFRLVAMPLVKPILAYMALNAFVFAYSSFMWAFVICPEQRMWTLMVWVYDFQMNNPGNNYIMAATVLVSIPPLCVFLVANRIIMRGIVIPSLK